MFLLNLLFESIYLIVRQGCQLETIPAKVTDACHTPALPQTIKTRFIAALLRHSSQITFASVRWTNLDFPC
ncbi:hypothetical protein D3C80_1846710 [compost metagenome]